MKKRFIDRLLGTPPVLDENQVSDDEVGDMLAEAIAESTLQSTMQSSDGHGRISQQEIARHAALREMKAIADSNPYIGQHIDMDRLEQILRSTGETPMMIGVRDEPWLPATRLASPVLASELAAKRAELDVLNGRVDEMEAALAEDAEKLRQARVVVRSLQVAIEALEEGLLPEPVGEES